MSQGQRRLAGAQAVQAGVAPADGEKVHPGALGGVAVGGLVAFVVFWILDRVRPGGFGWGDGKYIPIIGAATAAVSLSVAWWAFLIACVAAVGSTPFRRRRTAFPFGPWLAIGAFAAIALFG